MQTTAEDRAFLRRCFAFADRERRGTLGIRDLKCAVAAALGIRPSKLMLAQFFEAPLRETGVVDINDIRICEADFVSVMERRMQKTDLLEEVRRSFKAFDLRSQGFITFESFVAAAKSIVPHLPDKALFMIFNEADRNHDGRVTYSDFEAMYMLAMQLEQHQSVATAANAPHTARMRHLR